MKNLVTIMLVRNILLITIYINLYSFSGNYNKVEGRDENLQLKRQLKVLNKPPVQSFKKDGVTIDCIDVNKQPAFDHPLLKNHKLQIQPSKLLAQKVSVLLDQEVDIKTHDLHNMDSPRCPSGTIPLRRTHKKDLIMAKRALNHYTTMLKGPPFMSSDGIQELTQYAGVSTSKAKGTSTDKYLGARFIASLHNLTMMIPSQTSATSLRLGSAIDGTFSSVEYGYTFNQKLYGDRKARTFSLWTADGFKKTGCFNLLCPGFVQVSNLRHMGDEITYFSIDRDTKYMKFGIFQDPSTGNWWLIESIPQVVNHSIGYWPKELFKANSMKDYAQNVQAGGKVLNPSPEPAKTPMGTGHYIKTATGFVTLVNSSLGVMPEAFMEVMVNDPSHYQAQFVDHFTVLFGGPDIQQG